ncbi:hypothetical protein BBO99_00000039 [Phytophthora kernoviae]|uniref:Spindle assembly checkpoint component MAD1 n=2 Tax=Phytophthora kernoviae TaxID=325452 RepID=A0A421F725_9STRA|nr:hypothetical protein G195_004684 [Phytophthora kernoviae 00238/432]KAG2533091.1 hypothetical protein JM16_000195 [Phytophthora kernoviae]KAG2533398.1 hypothetical protein JM18_000158 [Phytophthora kernoviae]RLN26835.1 hypothetical protein BBI17_000039 [Phytophthora kernoviae]RLN85914.1 hypothetical protein BBO99_00000039 [Phytophthora kernoviae]
MAEGKRKALSSSFLCSPIPKDPSQVFYVGYSSSLQTPPQTKNSSTDSFLMDSATKSSSFSTEYVRQLQERVRELEKERKQARQVEEIESVRKNKRQRLEIESIAVSKSEELKREVEALRIQLETNSQRHQIELKERDIQLDKLRRQLKFAVTEEEETLKELKTATNEHSAEKLQLEKRVVELEAQLDLVEGSLNEWKEKALEASSQLRTVTRQSAMKSEDNILESKIRLLKSQLKEKIAHLRKMNTELVEILETYGKDLDDQEANELSAKRVALLESSLKQSQELIKGMESTQKTMATPAAVKKYEARIERLEIALSDAKQENGKLSKHLEKAEMELAILEKRLGRGEFNVETTKIVHLAVNPTHEMLKSKAKSSDVERLQQENEALRARLDKLMGGVDAEAPDIAASEDKFTTTTSYETVEGLKKLNQRLKQLFGDQIRQYREAVFLLTGYKVDLKKSNGMELLRLRSVYAEHDDDELLVRMEANGSLELLESEFCSQINQRVFAYLTTCRSFPAFLSTLTLHLFEKQTFQGN